MSYFRPIAKDIALNDSVDLFIDNGDFVVVESDQVHIEHIILAEKGNWREWPVLGVGIMRYLNERGRVQNRVGLQRKIRVQLEYDNLNVTQLHLEQEATLSNIKIEAKRIR